MRRPFNKGSLGPFGELVIAGIAIVVLSIILVMGTLIVVQVGEETWEPTAVAYEMHNISAASGLQNVTTTYLDNGIVASSYTLTLQDYGGSQVVLNETTNYVMTLSTGFVNLTSCTACNDTKDRVNASYSYDADTDATAVLDYANDSLSLFGSWETTIVIVIIAAVVLGVLVMGFVRRFSGEGM